MKLLLNYLWTSGIVVQARVCTAAHKHSCPHCTTFLWFSREVWVRSNLGALLTCQALCTWRAPTGGSYLPLKSLLLLWDDAGGMSLILFWIRLFNSIVRRTHTSFWVIIFSSFSSSSICIFCKEEAIFALLIACMLGPVPYSSFSCIAEWY